MVGQQILVENEFSELNKLSDAIKQSLKSIGYAKMTKIQYKCVPAGLKGRDILGAAKTGSGKTLAFVVPLLQRILDAKLEPRHGTAALILSPTRELSMQTFNVLQEIINSSPVCKDDDVSDDVAADDDEARRLGKLRLGLVIGGTNKKEEAKRLSCGTTILVATPGRLLDHLTGTQNFKTNFLKLLVIDEADRLMEQGFEEHMNQILSLLPKERQTMLFSATLNFDFESVHGDAITATTSTSNPKILSKVRNLARLSLKRNCVSIDLVNSVTPANQMSSDVTTVAAVTPSPSTNHSQPTVSGLTQHFIVEPPHSRFLTLYALLRRYHVAQHRKMMVFMSACLEVKFYYELLNLINIPVRCIHGKQKQANRIRVFSEFVEAESGVLLCTDVAARGLDIPRVAWIVQYDPPDRLDDYVHRVGRTARGQAGHGNSLLFLRPHEVHFLYELENRRVPIQEVMLDKAALKAGEGGADAIQLALYKLVGEQAFLRSSAVEGFKAAVRSYASMSNNAVFRIQQLDLAALAATFCLESVPFVDLNLGHKAGPNQRKRRREETTQQE